MLVVVAKLYETHGQESPHLAWLPPPGLSHLGKGLTLAKPMGQRRICLQCTDLSHDWVLLQTCRTDPAELLAWAHFATCQLPSFVKPVASTRLPPLISLVVIRELSL